MGCIRIPSLGDKADDGGDDSVGGAGSGRFFLSLLVAATVSGTGGKGRDDALFLLWLLEPVKLSGLCGLDFA